jgi:hypothetical protein
MSISYEPDFITFQGAVYRPAKEAQKESIGTDLTVDYKAVKGGVCVIDTKTVPTYQL